MIGDYWRDSTRDTKAKQKDDKTTKRKPEWQPEPAGSLPTLDPNSTTGFECSEFIKINHIADKPVIRPKEATDSIRSMEEKFTMDLELMIDATKDTVNWKM